MCRAGILTCRRWIGLPKDWHPKYGCLAKASLSPLVCLQPTRGQVVLTCRCWNGLPKDSADREIRLEIHERLTKSVSLAKCMALNLGSKEHWWRERMRLKYAGPRFAYREKGVVLSQIWHATGLAVPPQIQSINNPFQNSALDNWIVNFNIITKIYAKMILLLKITNCCTCPWWWTDQ